ncbi:MAG: glycosyltransferase family 4 protein [Phycisphaerales bacterium]
MPIHARFVQPVIASYRVPFFRALARSGVDVEVWGDLHPRQGSIDSTASDPEFRCVDAPHRTFGPASWQPGMARAARTPGADVLVMSGNARQLHVVPALKAARRAGLPTLLWMHGTGRTGSRVGAVLRRRMCGWATGFVCYSERVRGELEREGIDRSRLFVAPNSVDQQSIQAAVAAWTGDPTRLDRFRQEHDLAGKTAILYLSRLEREKRPDLILEAVAALRDHGDTQVLYIGKGSMREELEALARRLGLAARVRFLGAIYKDDEIAPWALSSSMLVHPGAIGLTVLHAFGFGLPVITANASAPHGPEFDAISDGQNGLVIPPGDAAALSNCIGRLLDDRAYLTKLATNARATVTGPRGYSIEGMVRGYREAFDAVIARRGA